MKSSCLTSKIVLKLVTINNITKDAEFINKLFIVWFPIVDVDQNKIQETYISLHILISDSRWWH